MSLESFGEKIEKSNIYIFSQRHKKVINIVQGIIVIGLLIGINSFVVKDYFIKQQIADHCGYTTSRYECVCEKTFVDTYKELQMGGEINLSFSDVEDVPLDR